MQTQIGIKQEHLAEAARILSLFLADEIVLYVKTRNAHWNVEGPDFHEKHKFFESQYEQLDELIAETCPNLLQGLSFALKCLSTGCSSIISIP